MTKKFEKSLTKPGNYPLKKIRIYNWIQISKFIIIIAIYDQYILKIGFKINTFIFLN